MSECVGGVRNGTDRDLMETGCERGEDTRVAGSLRAEYGVVPDTAGQSRRGEERGTRGERVLNVC